MNQQSDMFPELPKKEKQKRKCHHPDTCTHGICRNKECEAYSDCQLCKSVHVDQYWTDGIDKKKIIRVAQPFRSDSLATRPRDLRSL